jgi:hypothetical protein
MATTYSRNMWEQETLCAVDGYKTARNMYGIKYMSDLYLLTEFISVRLVSHFLCPCFPTSSRGWSVGQLVPYPIAN